VWCGPVLSRMSVPSRPGATLLRFATITLLCTSVIACQRSQPSPGGPPSSSTPGAVAVEGQRAKVGTLAGNAGAGSPLRAAAGHDLAIFAAGCFWGVEDAFRRLDGVTATTVGYTGGHTEAPDYEAVCAHGTGHAEAVVVEYDPRRVSFDKLLKAFFQIHDPTTLNRQGPDVGDQYRSAVFTLNDAQATAARRAAKEAEAREGSPVVTQITPLTKFWRAEDYHQQYAERTGTHGCPIRKLEGL
jgi:peptide-methionine (S)-S-oxide reductase